MKRVKITFEEGGELMVILNEKKAPGTVTAIWESLPIVSRVAQSRWSGREVNFGAKLHNIPERENQTIYTSKGEVCYWRNWRDETSGDLQHVIAIYYGAEKTRSHFGEEPVNVFGQIDFSQLELTETLGERIWLLGTEKITMEKVF